jgi:hypothetical protein
LPQCRDPDATRDAKDGVDVAATAKFASDAGVFALPSRAAQ